MKEKFHELRRKELLLPSGQINDGCQAVAPWNFCDKLSP